MARVTIEDCTRVVPNRFQLVQMAAIRTKQLKKGARSLVQTEGNKEVVTALREIAKGYVKPETEGEVEPSQSPPPGSGT
jgi:DNA-directed RNA polymerase subunit omega